MKKGSEKESFLCKLLIIDDKTVNLWYNKIGVNCKKRRKIMNIELKVERLKAFCKKYPYAFSNFVDLRNRLEKEGKEDSEYMEKLYKDYQYIINRRGIEKVSPKELNEAKIGGVFGLREEERELEEKYGINIKTIVNLIQDFGTIDDFRKAYIQYKIDLINIETDEEKEQLMNKNVCKYVKKLPLVDDFYLGNRESNKYRLINAILERDRFKYSKSIVIDEIPDDIIEKMLSVLKEREKKVIELRLGLKDGKKRTLEEIATYIGSVKSRSGQLEIKAFEKLRSKIEMLEKYAYVPTEEFIRTYFEMHDIFYSKDDPQISKEDREKLISIGREQRQIVEKQKELQCEQKQKEGAFRIDEIELSTRAYNCLRSTRIFTVSDLLGRIEEFKDFNKIRHLGPKSRDEIIEKIHSLGYKFKYEEEKITIETEEKLNINEVEKRDLNINEIGLSTRACNCLNRMGVRHVSDLLERIETRNNFLRVRNLGLKTIEEIIDKVHSLGFKFKYEEEEINEFNKDGIEENEIKDKCIEQKDEKEGNEERSQDSFVTFEEMLEDCNSKHTEICEKVEQFKMQKDKIVQDIEKLLNQLNGETNSEVTHGIATTIAQVYNILQEQKKSLKDLDVAIVESRKLEKVKREQRTKLTEKFDGMTQGGN